MYFVVNYTADSSNATFFNHLFTSMQLAATFVQSMVNLNRTEHYLILPYKENPFYNFEKQSNTWRLMSAYF